MTSLRSKIVKTTLKHSKLIKQPISSENLEYKRQAFKKSSKAFPAIKTAKTRLVKNAKFRGNWISVPESRKDKVVLYLAGGGFVMHTGAHNDFISRVAKGSKTSIFNLDYSLAPEHPYPAALNETVAAYKWLLKSFNAKDIVLAGDSSGGTLVLSALHVIKKDKIAIPSCAILIAPATDGTKSSPSVINNKLKDIFTKIEDVNYYIEAYFKTTPVDDPIASPLLGSLKGFPPLLIHVDKHEIMYDDSAKLAEKAKAAGVEVTLYETEGLWHVWHLFARYIPEAKLAIENINSFITSYIG